MGCWLLLRSGWSLLELATAGLFRWGSLLRSINAHGSSRSVRCGHRARDKGPPGWTVVVRLERSRDLAKQHRARGNVDAAREGKVGGMLFPSCEPWRALGR